ncbi:MAG: sarcosine oxidase subunit alpha family protein [Arenicellales bacterium]
MSATRTSNTGQLNRQQPLSFQFNGQPYTGFEGDTLASALLANNVFLIARSFKYHRPRGVFSAGSEEPSALVQLETGAHTLPNCPATEIELYDGLIAHSQNCWPSVKYDIGAVNNVLSRLFPAGFYYKTFMWPKALWMKYEHVIRHSAGLGKSPTVADPTNYDHQHLYCDVLIVGGGSAGLSAALAAAKTGAEILLINDQAEWGGALLSDTQTINDAPALDWINHAIHTLTEMPNVRLLARTTVTGYYHHNYLIANQRITNHLGPTAPTDIPRERLWKVRARKVVLATGAIERPLVFAENDRPGVMLAGAVRSFLNRYGVLLGQNIVILTNNDSAYALGIDALAAGANVTVLDTRTDISDDLLALTTQHALSIQLNSTIIDVKYKGTIQSVDVAKLNQDGSDIVSKPETIPADIVACSGGWTPTLHLYSQAGGKLKFDPDTHSYLPDEAQTLAPDAQFAGSCIGAFALEDCLAQGHATGLNAAEQCGFKTDGIKVDALNTASQLVCNELRPLWVLPCAHPIGNGPKKHFHELHNDSTIADIALAERENFISVEHLKRYTTTGMGTDQGKTSNVNALNVMAALRNKPVGEIGTTTFRPPFTPLTFGAIVGQNCGDLFLQKRTSPMEPWHQVRGAQYEDVGDWKRPRYFPRSGENMDEAVQRECKATRDSVGILDATTLGKIDIQGKDAAKLLNMVYTNAWSKLGVNRCRYGIMLNEHGMIIDDGVTTRLSENHFHMTTTTGGAARIFNWLEELLQTEYPNWEVYCTSVTEQWAVMAINGPKARDLLAKLTDADLSNESFPFMAMLETEVAGVPARIYRISFTGELAFEINVPARYGLHVWEAVMAAGEQYNICPYGTETMHVLRAEKGFIIVGQDTDGSVTPDDADMNWIVSKVKKDFIGKRSLSRSHTAQAGRKQLVGLLAEDPSFVLPEGAHIVDGTNTAPPMKMLGHVTSSYFSPNTGHSIAMAMLKDGHKIMAKGQMGKSLYVALMDGSRQKVTVTGSVFFDKEGVRSRG